MEATQKSKVMIAGFLAATVLFGLLAYWGVKTGAEEHIAVIKQVIREKGGELAEGGVMIVPADQSPFEAGGKGNTIFKITYLKDGETHTAWYRAKNQSSIFAEPAEWIFP